MRERREGLCFFLGGGGATVWYEKMLEHVSFRWFLCKAEGCFEFLSCRLRIALRVFGGFDRTAAGLHTLTVKAPTRRVKYSRWMIAAC